MSDNDNGKMARVGGGLQLDDPGLVNASSFVDGAFCKGGKGEVVVTNPANDGVVRRVAAITPADLSRAISSAARAFPDWRNTPAKERADLLRAWSALVTTAKPDLARIITLENGKPIAEAAGEVDYAIAYMDWYAAESLRAEGSSVMELQPGLNGTTFLEPVGVVFAISPWNFPAAMIARKLAPALAAGCTVIAKPSTDTPLTCLGMNFCTLRLL
jgi:succinate-semialdehyde dehydrogenase / glutarate-semialdehyde dehydrogenase